MSAPDPHDALVDAANRTRRAWPELVRLHFLEGLLRRIPQAGLVVRGSVLTRTWAAPFPRVVQDLDLVGTFPHDVAAVADLVLPALAVDAGDGVTVDVARCTAKGIWLDTAFPGVRLGIRGAALGAPQLVTIDVGFGDPLVPPAGPLALPALVGGPIPIVAVHPAAMIAWKLHALHQGAPLRWRCKDLLDLWLLLAVAGLAPDAAAIHVAFTSRGDDPDGARRLLDPGDRRWTHPGDAGRWSRYVEREIDPLAAPALGSRSRALAPPATLAEAHHQVAARLRPALP